MGRPTLYAKEIRAIILAERVHKIYFDVQSADDWVAWARANPEDAKLYRHMELLMKDEDG